MRDLARLGRYQGWGARFAGSPPLSASPAGRLTDASSIGKSPSMRPRAASSRPGGDDLVELLISSDRRVWHALHRLCKVTLT